jgi:hypothetical protein
VRPFVVAGAVIAAAACGSGRPAGKAAADSTGNGAPALPDSLAVRGPHGVEVWFTLARGDRGTDGTRCVDRTIEIRLGGNHIPVPLLYTEEAPRFVNDTTLEAVLYRACRPLDRYRVDLRTGQPTPVRPG